MIPGFEMGFLESLESKDALFGGPCHPGPIIQLRARALPQQCNLLKILKA